MQDNNLLSIKKRIHSTAQTRKITRTMELVASSRLQRGKVQLASYQGWMKHMREAAQCLPDSYFEFRPDVRAERRKSAYIVFGGNKGLSGSYSANILSYAAPIVKGHLLIAVGSAAEAYFSGAHTCIGDGVPGMRYSRRIAQAVKGVYEGREADEFHMIYTRGSSQLIAQIIPLVRAEAGHSSMIAEPSAGALYPALFEAYIEALLGEAHLHAFIAEQVARVSAMDSATRNADEILDNLQATHNSIRQSTITQEILMVSNAVARKEG